MSTIYDDRIKEQVLAANDIVDVISQYLPLKRAGRNFKAVCPFHQEKTPSLMVQPEKQIFRCFGCGVGGDVFSFIMRQDNLSFPEALRQLAERAHITLPAPTRKTKDEVTESEQLYEIYRLAADFYRGLKPRQPVWRRIVCGQNTASRYAAPGDSVFDRAAKNSGYPERRLQNRWLEK